MVKGKKQRHMRLNIKLKPRPISPQNFCSQHSKKDKVPVATDRIAATDRITLFFMELRGYLQSNVQCKTKKSYNNQGTEAFNASPYVKNYFSIWAHYSLPQKQRNTLTLT